MVTCTYEADVDTDNIGKRESVMQNASNNASAFLVLRFIFPSSFFNITARYLLGFLAVI